jgi:hypothetical protein
MTTAQQKDALVVFASRETVDVLVRAVQAAVVAARDLADIDVLVNGNPTLASAFLHHMGQKKVLMNAPRVRVWTLAVSDKAHAWNQYIRHIWTGEDIAFFMDGYVRLKPDALWLLSQKVRANAQVLGGTGVPSVGRTAETMHRQMLREGGFHGNFCCIKGAVIRELRTRGIALPFGLYRVDSLMGALLSFGLQPEQGVWEPGRIAVEPKATWLTDAKRWWRLADVRAKIKQVFRQSRGMLENAAVQDHFVGRKQSPETLPPTAAALVSDWAARCPKQLDRILARYPLARRELALLCASVEVRAAIDVPVLLNHEAAT